MVYKLKLSALYSLLHPYTQLWCYKPDSDMCFPGHSSSAVEEAAVREEYHEGHYYLTCED